MKNQLAEDIWFLLLFPIAAILFGLIYIIFPNLFSVFFSRPFIVVLSIVYDLFPFWAPPLLAYGFYLLWVQYIRSAFITSQKYVLLEILLPREVFKSPLAMELALTGFFQTGGETTWYDKYYLGKVRPWFTFEIASIEGEIHFYVWTRAALKHVVEAHLYGQYPDIDLVEVPDYTDAVPYYDGDKMEMWGHEYELEKEDPYPIKTYVDYGLDKDPKEEFKVDPLTSVLEYMATMGKGEQLWLQILFQAHKVKVAEGTLFGKTNWQQEGKEVIKKLRKELLSKEVTRGADGITYERIPTKGEADLFAAVDRNVSKLGFDSVVRVVYVSKPGKFNSVRIVQVIQLMRPFSSPELNSFVYGWGTGFDIDWIMDPLGFRRVERRKKMLKSYRSRGAFHPPFRKHPFVLSSEELATIFHIPGGVLQVPSVSRLMSKRADAPSNLPR